MSHEHETCQLSGVCGHNHDHHEHDHSHENACACGHDHHEHDHESACTCGHDHHEHHHDHGDACGCACGHDHHDEDGCGCGHNHGSGEANGKKEIGLAAASGILLAVGALWDGGWASTAILLAAYLLVGFDILRSAVRNILRGDIFDENFLMTVASIGALCIGEMPEAVLVMLLYRIGEYLQDRAVASSRRSIRSLMDIRPDHANLVEGDGIREVDAKTVAVGRIILLKPGDRVPLDGRVLEGESQLDTAALTGESMPRDCGVGDEVLAGCINLSGTMKVEVTKTFGDSAASRILNLVENASKSKAVSEKFITRFARRYTPIVCALAVVIAVGPALLNFSTWSESVYNALCFLVISCPCALVISVPLSFFAGIGRASRSGVLVKGGNYLDALAKTEIAAFDKTGTLTRGTFSVAQLLPAEGTNGEELLRWGAVAEAGSNHPIAKAITAAYGQEVPTVTDYRELSGHGVSAVWEGRTVTAGKADYIRSLGIEVPEVSLVGTLIYVALDGKYLGAMVLRDVVKDDAASAIRQLKTLGIARTVMLSGDNRDVVDQVAGELGISAAYSQLLPEDKLSRIEALKQELSPKGKLLYVGDGINDTPVLTAADIGVAMGGLGADAAIEAADAVIMGDEPGKIADAIRIARKTCRIANQNIVFSVAIKVAIMLLAAFGHIELWLAVFADVGVCMLTILNSLRINAMPRAPRDASPAPGRTVAA